MNLVDRVKNICLTPATEWGVIAGESSPSGTLISGYVAPLAGISALAGFIGGSLVGTTVPFLGTYRAPVAVGLGVAVFTFVMAIVSVFVISAIINALAPTFGAEKNSAQAFKVAVYAFTPAWVAGVLQVLPMLSILVLLASLYSLYVLYLGLPTLMKCPPEKSIGYTAVVVVCAIVLSVVIGAVAGTLGAAGMLGAGALTGSLGGAAAGDAQFDPGTPLGQLEQLGRQAGQAGRDIEAAGRSGDPNAQAAAAMNALGSLLGGGARVEPVDIDQLRPFVPETFAGLARTSTSAEKTGLAGIMISRAEARYGDGARVVTLDVQDTGGVSGIVGFANWVGVEQQKEDDTSAESTRRVDGRLVHEKRSKTNGTHEYGIVLGERFVVSATGRGVTLDELKSAVSGLDLGRLEAMKGAGPQR